MTRQEKEINACKKCEKECLYRKDLMEVENDIKATLIAALIVTPLIVGLGFLLQWLLPPELWESVLDILKWA